MTDPRTTPLSPHSRILIVGGGTWGCAAALELARRGYQNITVLDANPFPSPTSAGNDLNKIMEEGEPLPDDDDRDYLWHRLSEVATKVWNEDPVYKPYYHATGIVACAASESVYEHVKESFEIDKDPAWKPLDSVEDFRKTMPNGILQGDFHNWRGFFKPKNAGWVWARGTLQAVHDKAVQLGVKFITGSPQGAVRNLLYSSPQVDDAPTQADVIGAATQDGTEHIADRVILSAGATSDLLFDFRDQLRPTAWTLAHLPMTLSEAQLYRDLPVIYNSERGFFIEPDAENHEMKICDEHPGYTNFVIPPPGLPGNKDGQKRSIPFARNQIPLEAERRMRQLLRDTMPQLADRPFSFARICWDADTPNRVWIIDRHPQFASLTIAAGASGHGFGLMPAAGIVIADTLEGKMEERLHKELRWRPETAVGRDWKDTQGRYGPEPWNRVMDFGDVEGWTTIGENTTEGAKL